MCMYIDRSQKGVHFNVMIAMYQLKIRRNIFTVQRMTRLRAKKTITSRMIMKIRSQNKQQRIQQHTKKNIHNFDFTNGTFIERAKKKKFRAPNCFTQQILWIGKISLDFHSKHFWICSFFLFMFLFCWHTVAKSVCNGTFRIACTFLLGFNWKRGRNKWAISSLLSIQTQVQSRKMKSHDKRKKTIIKLFIAILNTIHVLFCKITCVFCLFVCLSIFNETKFHFHFFFWSCWCSIDLIFYFAFTFDSVYKLNNCLFPVFVHVSFVRTNVQRKKIWAKTVRPSTVHNMITARWVRD